MSDRQVMVSVKNVKKDFYRPHEKSSRSIKSSIVQFHKKKNKDIDVQHALRGVSFDVYKGEFFGIVGRNGSGKSTLLKMISGIYQPTKGNITTQGKLVPFIELGVGFNPELTGRENIYLNGALLGFTVKEIDEMYNEIVDFAELHEFMEQKLKNYSSGMQVRLAFAVAIKAQGDVLILDEVLAVGDEAFQRKCNDYFYKSKKEGKTVILVTHSMESVRQFCSRAVLINDGVVEAEGDPDKVADQYSKLFVDNLVTAEAGDDTRWGSGKVLIEAVSVECTDKAFSIKASLHDQGEGVGEVRFNVSIKDNSGYLVAGFSNLNIEHVQKLSLAKYEKFNVEFKALNIFGDQSYTVDVSVVSARNNEMFDSRAEVADFRSTRQLTHTPVVVPVSLHTKHD